MDSKIRSSMALDVEPIIQKSSKVAGTPHDSEWVLTIEWDETDKTEPVPKLLPACSATYVCRVRVVDPMYSDAHHAQKKLYTRASHISLWSLSLYEKNNQF